MDNLETPFEAIQDSDIVMEQVDECFSPGDDAMVVDDTAPTPKAFEDADLHEMDVCTNFTPKAECDADAGEADVGIEDAMEVDGDDGIDENIEELGRGGYQQLDWICIIPERKPNHMAGSPKSDAIIT
ncbi:hypothetical protein DFH11DRAFT_1543017 [Phellopilus nigrolimitatus]|nr:hypothetical protein DFH11DRAFT_1543017 [Phellopilus nigrolimitatus]